MHYHVHAINYYARDVRANPSAGKKKTKKKTQLSEGTWLAVPFPPNTLILSPRNAGTDGGFCAPTASYLQPLGLVTVSGRPSVDLALFVQAGFSGLPSEHVHVDSPEDA